MSEQKNAKQKILRTAFECLSEAGYASVSMRDIAKQSGVALSQLTYYFGTKERLFLEVIDVMTDEYLGKVEKKISTGAQEQKMGALIGYFKELISSDAKLLRLFVDLTAQAMWIPSFREKIDSMFKKLSLMIEANITGTRGRAKSASTAKLIFGALFGTSVQMLLDENETEYEPMNLTKSLLV